MKAYSNFYIDNVDELENTLEYCGKKYTEKN